MRNRALRKASEWWGDVDYGSERPQRRVNSARASERNSAWVQRDDPCAAGSPKIRVKVRYNKRGGWFHRVTRSTTTDGP